MKKSWIVWLAVLCIMSMAFILPLTAVGAEKVDSGTCGADGYDVTWTYYDDGTLVISGIGVMKGYGYSGYAPLLEPWLKYEGEIKRVVVEEGITCIGKYAFSSCINLVDVSLPSTLQSIEKGAFYGCSSLEHIEIPESVTQIGPATFGMCKKLTSVVLPRELDVISMELFEGCIALTDFNFPEGITEIGASAFINCDGLTILDIPDTVKIIGKEAFANCDNLEVVILHEGLETLKESLFRGSPKLKDIVIPASVTKLVQTFGFSDVKTVRFLGDAPTISEYAFEFATVFAYYPANNETWTEAVRQQYGGEITWVEDVCAGKHTPVTDYAVDATCSQPGLTQGQHCTVCGFVIVYQEPIPAKGHSFGEWIETKEPTISSEGAAERQCTICGEKEYKVLDKVFEPGKHEPAEGTCGEDLVWKVENGVLTISGTGAMTAYDKNHMPPWTAFCRVITKVVIEEGVTELSHKAFIDFEEMTTLEMADSVTQIGGQAFKNCYKLKSVKLSDNLKFIGDFAFGDCTALKEIHIPASVEEMDINAFMGCTALEKVWFYGDAPFVDMPFEGLTLTAYYPAGNETWTEKARAEFGGNVTWLEHGGNEETEPEETKPEETEPVETEPEETEPEETKPKDTEPEETEPEDTEPEDTEPVVTDPQEPVQTQPAETKPEETEPEDDRPPHTEVKPGDHGQSDNPVRSSWWVIVGIVAVILVIGPVVALIVVKSKK